MFREHQQVVRISLQRQLLRLLICVSVLFAFAIDRAVATEILPPGFSLPRIQSPEPSPKDVRSFDGLELADKGLVRLHLQFDRSPLNWADHLLDVTLGFPVPWSPSTFYALFPGGYNDEPDAAVAFIWQKKVRFPARVDQRQNVEMRSVNLPEFTIRQRSEMLVISYRDEKRWYFGFSAEGDSWRLARIENIREPGRFTEVQYSGELISAVVYPNGKVATIAYNGDLPSSIDTPFGERIVLSRTRSGFINRIDVGRVDDGRRGRNVSPSQQRYQLEYDANDRIIKYVAPSGRTYAVEMSQHSADVNGTRTNFYDSVLRRVGDSCFRSRNDEVRENGEWIITTRSGGPDDSPKDAEIDRVTRKQLLKHRWRTTGTGTDAQVIQTSFKINAIENTVLSVERSGCSLMRQFNEMRCPIRITGANGVEHREYNELGQLTRQTYPDGRETTQRYDEHGRVVGRILYYGSVVQFNYDDNSFPVSTVLNGQSFDWTFDEWGRLTKKVEPGGAQYEWTYDDFGRLVSEVYRSSQKDADARTTAYKYDNARLVSSSYAGGSVGGTSDKYIYSTGGLLTTLLRADGSQVRWRYDNFGRVVGRVDPAGPSEIYTYHPNGLVESIKSWSSGERPVTHHYDRRGRVVPSKQSNTSIDNVQENE